MPIFANNPFNYIIYLIKSYFTKNKKTLYRLQQIYIKIYRTFSFTIEIKILFRK